MLNEKVDTVYLANGYTVNTVYGQVYTPDRLVNLTQSEWDFFIKLLNGPVSVEGGYLRNSVRRLRAKIGRDSVENRHGFGYSLRLA